MSDKTNHTEPLFDNQLSKMKYPNRSMFDLIRQQLESPRLKRLHVRSTLRNWNSSLAFFQQPLNHYTPDDLMIDVMFDSFLSEIESCLVESTLAISTIENYTQVLHGNLLDLANVNQRVRKEVKQGIRNIRKNQRKVMPNHASIEDKTIVKWLRKLDLYCENPIEAPNLFMLANPKSKMKYKKTMSEHHLLLLRGFVWLTLATGARSGEIRALTRHDIYDSKVKRTVYKMKVVGKEMISELPEFILNKITPMLNSIEKNNPEATLLFNESDNKKGKGTIDPRLLQELVKGSMVDSGMQPTSPGGYYRLHDLRKVWARWIDENGGSLESISAFLGHSSPEVAFKAYFDDQHKQRKGKEGQQIGLNHLKTLLSPPSQNIEERLTELRSILTRGGSIYAEHSFGLRHSIKPTESAQAKLVPTPGLEPGTP
jgi:integrase